MNRAMLLLGAGLGLLVGQAAAQAQPESTGYAPRLQSTRWSTVSAYEVPTTPVYAAAYEYGSGCRGSAGLVAHLKASDMPYIGNYGFCFVVGYICPCAAVRVFCSLQPAKLQLLNCMVYIDPSVCVWDIGATSNTGGVAEIPMSIPAMTELLGAELFCQAAVMDYNGEFFQLGSLTNGLQLIFGNG